MPLTEYVKQVYNFNKEGFKTIEENWKWKESQGQKFQSYLRDEVMPSLHNLDNKSYKDELYSTALYHLYQEYPPDYAISEENKNGKIELHYDEIENYLIRKFCLVSYNKVLYLYKNGAFYENKGEIESSLKNLLMKRGFTDGEKFKPIKEEIMERLRILTFQREYPFNQRTDMISVRNGVITRHPWIHILPQSPVWGFTFSLPVCYQENTDETFIEEFLNSVVKEEDHDFLTQIVAQALLHSNQYQLAYLLVGSGANGKSTYINFIRAFLGSENCTSISLDELCNNKFRAADLQGKIMNVFPDLPKKPVKNAGYFKALTGGDTITVERKFCDPFQLKNTAVMVFSANELPKIDDDTFAWWRRWVVLEFPNRFGVNPSFECKLNTTENYSAFLRKVMRKMNEIEEFGIKRSKSVDGIMETWKKRSNPVYAFLVSRLIKDPKASIVKSELYAEFSQFCQDNDYVCPNVQKFSDEMQKYGAQPDTIGPKNARVRVWKGYGWKVEEPEKEAQDEPAFPKGQKPLLGGMV